MQLPSRCVTHFCCRGIHMAPRATHHLAQDIAAPSAHVSHAEWRWTPASVHAQSAETLYLGDPPSSSGGKRRMLGNCRLEIKDSIRSHISLAICSNCASL